MSARFVALHALHAVPPSLLNRDDTGATKTSAYGGTTRIRVSSQAWKRAMRVHARQHAIDGGAFADRTNRLPRLIADALTALGRDQDVAAQKAATVIAGLRLKPNEKTGNTAVQVFVSENTADRIADVINDNWDGITKDAPADVIDQALAAFDVANTVDLALYGRMIAEMPTNGKVDGAVSVAHAISVDRARITPDFFTAVDDKAADGEAVSSNLGVQDLSAPVLYRSATLDRDQLRKNLSGAQDPDRLTMEAERAFIDAFVQSVPSAKQRSTNATTLPSFVVMVETSSQPKSAADAFAKAVDSDDVLDAATTRLTEHLARMVPWLRDAKVSVFPLTADPARFTQIPGATIATTPGTVAGQ